MLRLALAVSKHWQAYRRHDIAKVATPHLHSGGGCCGLALQDLIYHALFALARVTVSVLDRVGLQTGAFALRNTHPLVLELVLLLTAGPVHRINLASTAFVLRGHVWQLTARNAAFYHGGDCRDK